ncbi:penicillin-binding protein 1A [Xenophilus arseniciresistens]|uniref:Penicillin-binding protein 1A n=1 Tax=Xenophilus arseniciresistens TaxID=1283306 RepID=A0AAE3NCH9_9BURK|nr:penicillin-binding protein 1A [Xenophilus arseniciresistens]MDA7419146.1 penicillin-binding protein 1A [Xenophilus arseniciresistens]
MTFLSRIQALAAAPRTRRMLLWGLGGLLALAVAGVVTAGVAFLLVSRQLPDVSSLADYKPKLPLRVFSADGSLIGEFGEERRQLVPIDQMPKVLKDAVLATEDARFYQHGGVDSKGLMRALVANLSGGRAQGASTITMQVARNMFLSSERTLTRKFNEVLLAYRLEERLTKDQILEIYLNQIYLGNRAYGFAAAAQTYFGKPVQQLTVSEAAMLAGLPKAPGTNNPVNNLRRAVARQQYVINRMHETGYLSAEEADAARAEPLRLRDPADPQRVRAEFVAEMVRQQMVAQYGDEAYTRGLKVYTTLTDADQRAAYGALREGIMDYELRQPWRGPEGFVNLPEDTQDEKALDTAVDDALGDHPDNGDLRAAVVLQADAKKLRAVRANGETVEITGRGLQLAQRGLASKAPPNLQIRRGSIIRVMQTEGKTPSWTVAQLPEVEGALVALDPRDGAVRALVGGFDFNKNKFNHVTQAWRQPGSAFKPFIYSAALEKGFMPTTVVNDAPLVFEAGSTGGQPWEPKNYDGTYEGPMSLRDALSKSKNLVTIRVLDAIGTQYAQEWIARFGFEAEKHPAYLPMALGAGAVTPLQMASAYSVFANGGWKLPPLLITRVTDHRDQVIEEWKPPVLDQMPRAIPERNAFVMDTLLASVVKNGTGRRAYTALRRDDLYGKTGTTNDSHDAWFAGFASTRVAVAWMGYDTPRQLGVRGETGGSLSLPVWTRYMQSALKGVPVAALKAPEGVLDAGGDWTFAEYAHGGGVQQLGVEEAPLYPPLYPVMPGGQVPGFGSSVPAEAYGAGPAPGAPPPPSSPERNRILDIFR